MKKGIEEKEVFEKTVLQDEKLIIKNDKGERIECDKLFTFDSDETGKSYIAYTDNTLDKDGKTRVYASIYDPTGKDPSLKPLTSEKEWKVIEIILSAAQEKFKEDGSTDDGRK